MDGFVEARDGVRLFQHVVGGGATQLIVPGIGAEFDFEPLARDRRVAFFDIRNRGRSDAVPDDGEVGFPVEVDDIEAVREAVGAERVAVMGWSYVGLVAALYAARYAARVERLVMVCPAPPAASFAMPKREPDPGLAAEIEALYEQEAHHQDPVAFAREWRRLITLTRMADPRAFARLRSDPSSWPNEWPDHLAAALERVFATHPPAYDYRPEAAAVTAPSLIIHGEADAIPLSAAQAWRDALPTARLLVLPGVGHYPHAEAPETFFDAVQTFLTGSWPANAN